MMEYRENLQKCHEYIRALEEEKQKIEMIQRELPLCFELVTQAIEAYKQQLLGITTTNTTTTTITTDQCLNGQSECSEQTASDGPVFEEFIPIKRPSSATEGEEEEDEHDELESHNDNNNNKFNRNSCKLSHDLNDKSSSSSSGKKKINWLQLWNQSPDPPTAEEEEHQNHPPRKVQVVEVKGNGSAFHPFQKEKNCYSINNGAQANIKPIPITITTTTKVDPIQANSATSSADRARVAGASSGSGSSKEEDGFSKDGQGQPRKARRCWSPELHKKFLNALQQLGGSHVATPKQIRELMKVDGLTNDEVKSHLQKYRLHTRRPNPAIQTNTSTQAPQFVVVGGIWVASPQENAAVAPGTTPGGETATAPASAQLPPHSGIYTPVVAPVAPHHGPQAKPTTTTITATSTVHQQQQQMKQVSQSPSEERGGSHNSHSSGSCNSSGMSSHSHDYYQCCF